MILLALGLPGSFAQWGEAVLLRLVTEAGGDGVAMSWPPARDMLGYEGLSSTLDEVGRVLIGDSARHLVIGAHQPDGRLCQALAAQAVPFVVLLDDPRNAVADFIAETAAAPKLAVRAIANSCPLVLRCRDLPGALVVHADRARGDLAGAASAIAAHFGLAIEPERIASVVTDLAPLTSWMSGAAGDELATRLPDHTRKMLDGALLSYRASFIDGQLDQILWTRDLFGPDLEPGGGPIRPIDITGGGQFLIYGPYIQLPAGSWVARVVLGFSPETAGAAFIVDAFAEKQLAFTTIRPDRPGVYNVDLTFSIEEPNGKGVEVRVMVVSDGARGQLAFGHVALRPTSLHQPEAPGGADDFAAVLGL